MSRRGLTPKTGIELYKSLIRPCWEFLIAAWATTSEKGIKLLEQVQARCLRAILGTKSHTSADALHVVANVTPVRLRIQYLCTLEFTRISCKSVTSKIHSLLLQAQACQSGITPSTTSSFSPNPLVTRWKTCLWNSNTLYNRQIYLIVQSTFRLVAWHSGRTSVSGWRTFLVLRSTCS